jgi:hypothetical protein
MKYLGITEEFTACDCCGKSNLQCTVAFEREDGEVVHYGRTCAARNTGKSVAKWQGERNKEVEALKAKARAEHCASAEYIAYAAKLAEGHRLKLAGQPNRAFYLFVKEASEASGAKEAEIKSKYGLK